LHSILYHPSSLHLATGATVVFAGEQKEKTGLAGGTLGHRPVGGPLHRRQLIASFLEISERGREKR
jgi:hypothetical protein